MSFYLSSFFYFFEKQLSFAYTELWIIKKELVSKLLFVSINLPSCGRHRIQQAFLDPYSCPTSLLPQQKPSTG